MSNLFILAFVFTIIWKLSYGMGLNCVFAMGSFPTLGSIYNCNVNSITIDTANKESITVVNGTHTGGRTNADVLELRIFNKGIAQFFPNVKGLSFDVNSISYVNNQHLFPLRNLVFLDMDRNKITSLDSNLFSGLSMQWIRFSSNNIKHVGHDFILPNTLPTDGYIYFQNNPCINRIVSTPSEITALRTSLLENCQPNWLINVTVQTQSLVNRTDGIEQSQSESDSKVKSLTNAVADLENRNLQLTNKVTELQQSNVELTNNVTNVQESNAKLTNEVTALTNEVMELQQNNSELSNELTKLQQDNEQLTNEVEGLIDQMADLQESNVELTMEMTELQQNNFELTNELTELQRKNSQLETRIGFVDNRAGYLEVRVAVLESIIENK